MSIWAAACPETLQLYVGVWVCVKSRVTFSVEFLLDFSGTADQLRGLH